MKKRYFVAAALMIFLTGCVGSTTKITYISVDQEGAEKNEIDFTGADLDTKTDQSADGQLDSAVDVTPVP